MVADPFENLKGKMKKDLKVNSGNVDGLKKYRK